MFFRKDLECPHTLSFKARIFFAGESKLEKATYRLEEPTLPLARLPDVTVPPLDLSVFEEDEEKPVVDSTTFRVDTDDAAVIEPVNNTTYRVGDGSSTYRVNTPKIAQKDRVVIVVDIAVPALDLSFLDEEDKKPRVNASTYRVENGAAAAKPVDNATFRVEVGAGEEVDPATYRIAIPDAKFKKGERVVVVNGVMIPPLDLSFTEEVKRKWENNSRKKKR